jgi:hypothetical protein
MEVKIEKEGTPFFAYRFTFSSLNSLRTLAKQINTTIDVLTPHIDKCVKEGTATFDLIEQKDMLTIKMRGIQATADTAREFQNKDIVRLLKEVFDWKHMPQHEPVISWEGSEELAVVDIDYHNRPMHTRPTFDVLNNIAANVSPLPICYHASHGRGCKLYYVAQDGYTAAEIAAAGALSWMAADPRATAEIKTDARHPCYPRGNDYIPTSIYYPRTQELNLAEIARWYGKEAKPEAVEAWLAERNLAKNKHFSHANCPIEPQV